MNIASGMSEFEYSMLTARYILKRFVSFEREKSKNLLSTKKSYSFLLLPKNSNNTRKLRFWIQKSNLKCV